MTKKKTTNDENENDNNTPTTPAATDQPKSDDPAKASRLPALPTRGRVLDFVTDEKVLVPAIVSRIFQGEGDAVQMHVAAIDPVFGNRNYHVADVYAAHRQTLGTTGLKTVQELDQEADSLEPGTWSWPQRQ